MYMLTYDVSLSTPKHYMFHIVYIVYADLHTHVVFSLSNMSYHCHLWPQISVLRPEPMIRSTNQHLEEPIDQTNRW